MNKMKSCPHQPYVLVEGTKDTNKSDKCHGEKSGRWVEGRMQGAKVQVLLWTTGSRTPLLVN